MTKWTYDKERKTGRLAIDGGLTIACVSEVRDLLLQGCKEAPSLVLDLTAAAEIDVAGLQLICSAHRHAVKNGKEIHLKGSGDRVSALVRNVGFDRGTHCPEGCENLCFWAGMA